MKGSFPNHLFLGTDPPKSLDDAFFFVVYTIAVFCRHRFMTKSLQDLVNINIV